MGDFDGRVAIITGGTRGIGAAVSTALAQGGAHVAAGYHRSQETADRFQREAAAQGLSVSTHQGNVGNPEDCVRVAGDVLREQGRIDLLVNNAGVTVDKTVRKMTVEDWHAVLRINLSGAFYMVKAVLDHMLERGSGRIINISSVVGETGNIGQANYAASKSGLFGFTKSLALETARRGITVNCVAPGFIDTEMVAAVPEETLKQVIARIPVQRLGTAQEVARVVRFLCEDDAGYMTGAIFAVNGGIEM
jgi:NAD(P)-dependent dehydrogenase (short-subunit alcohol dehydrogenase family)